MNGDEIQRIRLELGLSQKEFGKKYGYTSMAVSYWESGKRKIPQALLYKMFGKPKELKVVCPHCRGNGKITITV